MAGEPQSTRWSCAHKLIALLCGVLFFLVWRGDLVWWAIIHIFKVGHVILDVEWGRSLGRYDDTYQKNNNTYQKIV